MKLSAIWIVVLLFCISCAGENPSHENLNEKIEYLIDDHRYEVALEELEDEDIEDPAIRELLEKTHLNYGLYNMNTFDEREMRTRMNDALRQFAEVLQINPRNEVARTNINQILQIYSTIPDRQPEEDVVERLRQVGINTGS